MTNNPHGLIGRCDLCYCDIKQETLGYASEGTIYCKGCTYQYFAGGSVFGKEELPEAPKEPTPSSIKAYLDRFVVGQDEAKKVLAVAGHTHYLRTQRGLNIPKANILLCGHTGSGKTYLMERLSECLDIPFHMDDCSQLTADGYVGRSVTSVIEAAWNKFGSKAAVQNSIIFFDEFDKKRKKSDSGRDVAGESVQEALLKLLEGTSITIEVGKGNQSREVEIDTSNITFVFSGAFADLMKETVSNGSIGFGQSIGKTKKKITRPKTEDFINYGIMPEVMGRLSSRAFVDELTKSQLIEILTKTERNAIGEMQNAFSIFGHKLVFEPKAIEQIAIEAIENKTGARGLKSIVEGCLLNTRFDMPDWKDKIEVTVTKDTFKTGRVKLKKLK